MSYLCQFVLFVCGVRHTCPILSYFVRILEVACRCTSAPVRVSSACGLKEPHALVELVGYPPNSCGLVRGRLLP